jgi:hypothetical protein
MGIAESSWYGTAAAAGKLAASAVDYDARQDEHHADDPGQVGEVLDARVPGVVLAGARNVDDDVERAGEDHDREPEPRERGKRAELPDASSGGFYRQHSLLIQPDRPSRQVYR